MTNPGMPDTNPSEFSSVQLRNDYGVNVLQLTPSQELLCNGEVESQVSEDQARVLGALMLSPDTWLSAQELLAKNEPPTAMEARQLRSIIRGLAQASKVLSQHILQGGDSREVQFALVQELEDSKPSSMPKQKVFPSPRVDYATMNEDLERMISAATKAGPKRKSRTRLQDIRQPEPTPHVSVKPAVMAPVLRHKDSEAVMATADARHITALAKRARNNLRFLAGSEDNPEGSMLVNRGEIELIITDFIYHSHHGLPIDSKSVWNEILRECSLVTYTEEHFLREWEAYVDKVPTDALLMSRVTVMHRRNPSTGAKERGLVWMPKKTL